MSLVDRFKKWSVLLKAGGIIIMLLILTVPIQYIRSLVSEREGRMAEAEAGVINEYGGSPALAGPFLIVPYEYTVRTVLENGIDEQTYREYACFLPETLSMTGTMDTEVRSRGIYDTPVFNADLEVRGTFVSPDPAGVSSHAERILWNEAFLAFEAADNRCFAESVGIEWNGATYPTLPAAERIPLYDAGITAAVPVRVGTDEYAFSFRLAIRGGGRFSFLPVGGTTEVALRSSWTSPSFVGAFLPAPRTVNDEGFEASWRIFAINNAFPRSFYVGVGFSDESWNQMRLSETGVDFINPMNEYVFNERSVKYALLFLCIPFVAFFLIEILSRARVHPLQYLLVGIANVLFYLLLLSLSELIGFDAAYPIGAAAVVLLVGLYTLAVLPRKTNALIMAGSLVAGYGALFVILKNEEHALLLGSLFLFAVVALFMLLTRKVDWYKTGAAIGNGIAEKLEETISPSKKGPE